MIDEGIDKIAKLLEKLEKIRERKRLEE